VDINIPEVVAEVRATFERYEKALVANDVEALDSAFWKDPRVIRYAITDNAYGFEAIHASRLARQKSDLARTLEGTVITTFGRDLATANTEFPARGVGQARPSEPDVDPVSRRLARCQRPRLVHAYVVGIVGPRTCSR
jgi:hypothetical protein